MSFVRNAVIVAAGLAVGAAITRPGPDAAEIALRDALYRRLFTENIDAGRDMLGNAALIACRVDPASCYDLLRSGLDVSYENRVLYGKVTVEGFGRRAECWGLFGKFTCPGGFKPDPER